MITRPRVSSAHIPTRPRILVPVLIGQMARPVISLGDALASSPGGSGSVLGLVEIRSGRDNEVFAQEQRRRDALTWLAGLEYVRDGRRRMGVSLRMTANAASSVRDAVAENDTTTVVLEWPTLASPRRHGLMDLTRQLLADAATDIFLVRSKPETQNDAIAPRSILAPIRGGPSARLVAASAATLADVYGSLLTLLHVQASTQHPDRSRREWQSFEEIVAELNRPATIVTFRRRDSAAAAIFEESAGHDLVMVGSRIDPAKPNTLIGRDIDRMLRHVGATVVMVRSKVSPRHEPLRSGVGNGHHG